MENWTTNNILVFIYTLILTRSRSQYHFFSVLGGFPEIYLDKFFVMIYNKSYSHDSQERNCDDKYKLSSSF